MNQLEDKDVAQWFAIRTMHDFRAAEALTSKCEDVFFPTKNIRQANGKFRRKAVIPHVLFIKTTKDNALALEREGRLSPLSDVQFWIFRYPKDPDVQVIPQRSIDLLKLLTADDTSECRIYNPAVFHPGEEVRIVGGLYKGYEGFVKRIDRDRRVVVKIEGVCMVILPFIHPDLLVKKTDNQSITGKTVEQGEESAISS